MDSIAPDWFWFWFWFGLLLLLWFTLPVAPSQSTLSTLTCLGHHIWGVIQDPDSSLPTARREQEGRPQHHVKKEGRNRRALDGLQNGQKRRQIGTRARISRGRLISSNSNFGFSSESSGFSSFSSRSASRSSSSRSNSASGTFPPAYSSPQPPEASEKVNMQAAFEDFLKVFFLGYMFHCQQQRLQAQQQAEQQADPQ